MGLSGSPLLPLFGDGCCRIGGVGASGRWGLALWALLHRTSALDCFRGSGAFVDQGSGERCWCLLCARVAGLIRGLQHGAASVLGRYLLLLLLLEDAMERLFLHEVPGPINLTLGALSSEQLGHALAPHEVRLAGHSCPEAARSSQAVDDHLGDGLGDFLSAASLIVTLGLRIGLVCVDRVPERPVGEAIEVDVGVVIVTVESQYLCGFSMSVWLLGMLGS